jgi:hypothetical protein
MFHDLLVCDPGQGIQEKAFRLGRAAAIEPFFHRDPEVIRIIQQETVQPEAFFHFSFYKISLDRVPDLAVNGYGKPAAAAIVFQKI